MNEIRSLISLCPTHLREFVLFLRQEIDIPEEQCIVLDGALVSEAICGALEGQNKPCTTTVGSL